MNNKILKEMFSGNDSFVHPQINNNENEPSITAKPTRTEKRRAEVRKNILKTAAIHFSEKGIHDTKLEEIADAVDIAKGTLYSHFATKEILITEILRSLMEDAADKIEKINLSDSVKSLEELLYVYFRLWEDHSHAWKIAFEFNKELGDLESYHKRIMSGILKIFELLKKDEILRTNNPELSTYIFYFSSMHLMEIYSELPNSKELFVESMKGLLINGQLTIDN